MGKPIWLKNPHLRARLAESLECLLPHHQNQVDHYSIGSCCNEYTLNVFAKYRNFTKLKEISFPWRRKKFLALWHIAERKVFTIKVEATSYSFISFAFFFKTLCLLVFCEFFVIICVDIVYPNFRNKKNKNGNLLLFSHWSNCRYCQLLPTCNTWKNV